MKLAVVELDGLTRVARVLDGELIDLTLQLGAGCDDLAKFLSLGTQAHALAASSVTAAVSRLPIDAVKFRSPVPRSAKIIGIGLNYRSFLAAVELAGMVLPTGRIWFYRPSDCIAGPYDDVWLPRGATDLDYEGELAIVIGRRCRYVSVAEAPSVIGGFTVANDLTLRRRVLESPVLGKSFETHTPFGPWLVTPEEIGDPHDLAVRTWVNGELRQNGHTSDMIVHCAELIAELSSACTLNPGDVILTGTSDGCGAFQRPPAGLAVGDVVKVEIERIGAIENRVVEEAKNSGALLATSGY